MKTIRLSSLGLKILVAYVVGALLSIALAVAVAVWTVQNDVLAGLELAERVDVLANKVRFDGNGKPIGLDVGRVDDTEWIYDSLPKEAAYRILDANGEVVLFSSAGKAFWPDSETNPHARFSFERNNVTMHGATTHFSHGGKVWRVQFAVSARLMHLTIHKFALPLMGAGIGIFSAILIVAFGLCAYITLGHALEPLRNISESAAAISSRSLHSRLQVESVPAEIAPLVDSFNRALERIEHGYRLQQEFLATTAHELKTPLALIRAQVEPMGSDDQQALLKDVEHMTRQVQQLLHLAEVSEIQSYRFISVDVQEVVVEVVNYLQRMAATAGVFLVITNNAPGLLWQADRGGFFTLLKNLLENAIQHAPQGTEIHLKIDNDMLSIRDWGAGVPQEQLSQIFSRFWRGHHRRDHGAGLGLAICQEIALAHGWTLSAYKVSPGLRFCVSLPTADFPKDLYG